MKNEITQKKDLAATMDNDGAGTVDGNGSGTVNDEKNEKKFRSKKSTNKTKK